MKEEFMNNKAAGPKMQGPEMTIHFDIEYHRINCGLRKKTLADTLGISRWMLNKYINSKMIPQSVYDIIREKIPQWINEG
jgi:DNA-binding XRE family transcriptional regulator